MGIEFIYKFMEKTTSKGLRKNTNPKRENERRVFSINMNA